MKKLLFLIILLCLTSCKSMYMGARNQMCKNVCLDNFPDDDFYNRNLCLKDCEKNNPTPK